MLTSFHNSGSMFGNANWKTLFECYLENVVPLLLFMADSPSGEEVRERPSSTSKPYMHTYIG
jgi:hypothetical protein